MLMVVASALSAERVKVEKAEEARLVAEAEAEERKVGTEGKEEAWAAPTASLLVLLGDTGVGKSCIVLRFVKGQFDANSKARMCARSQEFVTVGAAFLSQSVTLSDNTTVRFEIWDTAGQERYASLVPLYYRGASAAAVVYDITNKDTFDKARFWTKELHKHGAASMVIILVGNKTDLEKHREVPVEEARAFAEENSMLFIETSAKQAINVSELFERIAERLPATTLPQPPAVLPAVNS
eukprot:jgi/Chlat1/6780/Chrsp50S09100